VNTFKIFAPMLKASMGPDGRKRLHGIASSTVKDRHGDTMQPSALLDMERSANNNLTIFLNHSYDVPEDVAGHVEMALLRSHPQDPDIHDLAMDIVVNETNPRAVKAWEAIDGGTQLGLSIGAMIPEGGAERDRKSGAYSINHVELLETSLVGVPANPRSWVEYAVKSLNAPTETFNSAIGQVTWSVSTDDPEQTVEEVLLTKQACVDCNHTASCGCTDCSCGNGVHGVKEAVEPELIKELEADELDHHDDPLEAGEGDPPVEVEPEVTPDITDATVQIEMPGGGKVHIDTGNRGSKPVPAGEASQEAQLSAPETEDQDETEDLGPWAGIMPVKSALIDTDVQTALQLMEPSVVASLRNSTELLKAITRELIDTKQALAQRNDEYEALEEATKAVVTKTGLILDKLSNTPVGRRAVVREASDQFASLKSVYSEEFLTLLKKG
jgi:HK97 family phage prohead protease